MGLSRALQSGKVLRGHYVVPIPLLSSCRGAAGCWLGNCTADGPGPDAETLIGPHLPLEGSETSMEGPQRSPCSHCVCMPQG